MAINLDLAMMALEGLTQSPVTASSREGEVVIEASPEGFKELARLMLLLGSEGSEPGEEVILEAGLHAARGSLAVRLRRRDEVENRK